MINFDQKKGFSLIEVMISLGLISLILSFGLLSIKHINRSLVKSDMENLYAICTYLQQVAMVTNKKQFLAFDIASNSYSYHNHTENLSPYTRFGLINNTIKGPPSKPTSIIKKAITFIGNKITFTPKGILQPGTIYLTDKNKQYQYALTIPISQISFLRKYQYTNQWELI